MDITILLTIISGLVIIVLFFLLCFKGEKKEEQARARGVPGPRRAVGARNARARQRAAAGRPANAIDDEDDQNAILATLDELDDPKLGAKKRAKLEAKAERKLQREVYKKIDLPIVPS